MTFNTIRLDVADGVATVTLHRPERLNAFTPEMQAELIAAFDRTDADDAVRAVIVTGEGRAFCAGADLGAGAGAFDRGRREDAPFYPDGTPDYGKESARDGGGMVTLRIFRSLKPVIAAINGPAVGIGATMTLPMDARLASEAARIGFVFARRGIVPEAASSWFLPRLVGVPRALDWCYSGRVLDAAEALAGGLVGRVLPADELLPAARALAASWMEGTAPVSQALIRQMMWRGLGMADPMDAHRVDSRGILSRGRSRDVAEGVSSFLEKRVPAFPDKVSSDMPDYFPWWEEAKYG